MQLLIMKIMDIFLGIFITYKLAISLEENFYLLGILNMFTMFFLLVGNFGVENVLIRNRLFWENNKNEKIIYYQELAFYVKNITSVFCIFISMILSYYYNFVKYKSDFLFLFIIFIFSAYIESQNNTCELLLIAKNKYKKVYFSKLVLNTLIKFFLVYFYKKKEITFFLSLYALIPIFRFIYLKRFFILKKQNKFNLNMIFIELKKLKFYIFENYIRFFTKIGDQFLVSIFFSSQVLSTYSLIKNLENVGLAFIGTVFDPLIQKEVKNKSNIYLLNKNLNKINRDKNILVIIGIFLLFGYYFYANKLIQVFRFDKYLNFREQSLGLGVCLLIYLFLKVKNNCISLFFSPVYRIYNSFIVILILPCYFYISSSNIIFLRILYYICYFFIINFIFYKNGGNLSEKNIYNDV